MVGTANAHAAMHHNSKVLASQRQPHCNSMPLSSQCQTLPLWPLCRQTRPAKCAVAPAAVASERAAQKLRAERRVPNGSFGWPILGESSQWLKDVVGFFEERLFDVLAATLLFMASCRLTAVLQACKARNDLQDTRVWCQDCCCQ